MARTEKAVGEKIEIEYSQVLANRERELKNEIRRREEVEQALESFKEEVNR